MSTPVYTVTKLGQDIKGEAENDQSGWSVSINSDGTIVAISATGASSNPPRNNDERGHVRVYQYNGTTWQQLGSDIDGEVDGENIAESVSLSSDGTILAIGGPFGPDNTISSGHVKVYQYNGTNWTQLGIDIDGENVSDRSGISVSLSSDGTVVAIGAPYSDVNGSNSGHVKVCQYNESTNFWDQLGQDINGETAEDYTGWYLSLSNDGTTVAIGDNNVNDNNSGRVRVYRYENSLWTQIGQDIVGEAAQDFSKKVSINSDGTILAIGANNNDGNGSNSGHVRLYQYNGTNWTQIGNDIDGKNSGDKSGYSVSLSSDGTVVAIGAPYNNNSNGFGSGHVRVYSIASNASSSGDPYLHDIYGNLMKLPDANKKYTMLITENEELKVDITTVLLNNYQKAIYWNQCKEYFPLLENKNIARENLLRTFTSPLCFIRNVEITYNNEITNYDLFQKLENTSPINDDVNGAGVEKILKFNVDGKTISIKLQKFQNPQVITGVSYQIPPSITVSGLITDTTNYQYRMITEDFITNKGKKSIKMRQLL